MNTVEHKTARKKHLCRTSPAQWERWKCFSAKNCRWTKLGSSLRPTRKYSRRNGIIRRRHARTNARYRLLLMCSASSSRFSTFRLPSFCPLKDAPRGYRFTEDGELKHSVREEHDASAEFYATGIHLTQKWKSTDYGDFVEK